jgi:hypothetical protein
MSELTYRSFYTGGTTRQIGPYGVGPVSSAISVTGFSFESFYEAIVRDPRKDRNKVSLRDVEIPERELLVEVDKRVLQRLKMWKSFQHYKRWYDHPMSSRGINDVSIPVTLIDDSVFTDITCPVVSYQEVPITGVFDATSHPNSGMEEWFDSVGEDGYYVLAPTNIDELISRSLKSLVPKVKAKVQLLNSLIELKDFVTLKKTINRVKNLGSALRSRGIGGSLRDVAGSAADLFLQMQFNIKPLISDIQGIHDALVDSLGRFRLLMQFDGVPQVTKYRRDLREVDGYSLKEDSVQVWWPIDPYYDVVFNPHQGWAVDPHYSWASVFRGVTIHKDLFSAQLRFIARWSQTQHRYAEQLGLIDALGLSFNPKHVWDAIPWSFVIDWVVKVGDFLDQFKRGALDPVLDVLDYSWSISREREIDLAVQLKRYREGSDPPVLIEDKLVVYPTFRETAYSRQPIEVGRNALIVSELSLKEISLATSLVIARATKRRKPGTKRRGPRFKRVLRSLKRAK